jgi:hypothetical protein
MDVERTNVQIAGISAGIQRSRTITAAFEDFACGSSSDAKGSTGPDLVAGLLWPLLGGRRTRVGKSGLASIENQEWNSAVPEQCTNSYAVHELVVGTAVGILENQKTARAVEHVPSRWKVIQHVREKFSCRSCETIAGALARGRAGPFLLAHILFCKYGLHLPLHRRSATYAREGVELDVSTLADWVGAAAATLMPLVEAIRAHVFAAERIHADDTTVPVLAKGKCRTGRLWTYVRDDRPFAGTATPGAFFYSADRGGVHPEAHLATYAGLMQADAYAGLARRRARPASRSPRQGDRRVPALELETAGHRSRSRLTGSCGLHRMRTRMRQHRIERARIMNGRTPARTRAAESSV